MVEKENEYQLPDFVNYDSEKISLGWIQFVFAQAEKRLVETTKTAETITMRGYSLLGIEITLATIVMGYVFTHKIDDQPILMLSSILMAIILALALIYSIRCILPYDIDVAGSEPKCILFKEFVESEKSEDQQKTILISEIKSYQERINSNRKINSKRFGLFNKSLFFACIICLCPLAVWGVSKLFPVV